MSLTSNGCASKDAPGLLPADVPATRPAGRSSVGLKTLGGLFTTGASKVVLIAANLVITGTLANLLEPSDFGLVGMVGVFTALLSMLSSLGFDSAIVQKSGLNNTQLSTLFWIRMLAGLLCAALLALAAYPIALFYKDPRLVPITQCLALVFVSSATYQNHRSLLRRDLRFSAIAGNTVASVVGSGILGVVVAFQGGGVWSLVAQGLSLDVISSILYWRASTWRPAFQFNWKETSTVVRFGLTMTGASFTLYVQRNIDMMMIGRMLGSTPLGYYALAYRIMYSPVRQMSYIFTDVLFPSFAKIQNEPAVMRRGYCRSLQWIALVTFPAMTLVAFQAAGIVQVLFGDAWLPAAAVLTALAPAGALQSVAQIGYVIYPVVNRPDLAVKLGVFNCVALTVGVLIGAQWGAPGAAVGVLVATTCNWIATEAFVGRLLDLHWFQLGRALRTGLLGSAWVACVSLAFAQTAVAGWPPLQRLALIVSVAVAGYLVLVALAERDEVRRLVSQVREILATRRRRRAPG